jgi:hypothetical protein
LSETIVLADSIAPAARAEADRTHAGNLSALASASLSMYLAAQASKRAVVEQFPNAPGEDDADWLGRVITGSTAISRDAIASMAVTLARAAGTTVSVPGAAAADHLRHYLDWTATNATSHVVACTVITTQPADGPAGGQSHPPASFATGFLHRSDDALNGTLDQYFSDRTAGPAASPFNPAERDRLGVHLAVDSATGLVTAELTAVSWGGGRQLLTEPEVRCGVLLFNGESVGNLSPQAAYAISLATSNAPV